MLWRRKSPERVDLSETSEFFLALKQNNAWRERLVTELRFGLRNHLRSVNSYQINFPPELLRDFGVDRSRTANLLLPLTTREKRPLLNLSVGGPGGAPATVTSRPSIAALQTEYLVLLAEQSPAQRRLCPLIDERLWEAICAFSLSFFETTFFSRRKDDLEGAIASYLSSGLHFDVASPHVRGWRERSESAREALKALAPEPSLRFSSSEEMLLAIPDMSPSPKSIGEIDRIVDRYVRGVEVATHAGDSRFLSTLAEYGQRYELIVEVEIPLLEPSRVRLEEDLPLELQRHWGRYWVEQTFALGDARSAHLEARLDDTSVEIPEKKVADGGGVLIRDLAGRDASGWLEALRVTREAIAMYGSEPGRPRYMRIRFRLRIARHVMAAAVILTVLNLAAILMTCAMQGDNELASRLAVLAVPTTVAATFVLIREQTALATRLQTLPRLALALSAIALWVAVSVRIATTGDERLGEVRPAHASDSELTKPPAGYDESSGGRHG
jgi:hypothetical protein